MPGPLHLLSSEQSGGTIPRRTQRPSTTCPTPAVQIDMLIEKRSATRPSWSVRILKSRLWAPSKFEERVLKELESEKKQTGDAETPTGVDGQPLRELPIS
jgi:hypothetical protein